MFLHCEFDAAVERSEADDYVRHLVMSAKCYDADIAAEYTVGKLAMDQILWLDAITDGMSLYEICDNASQDLHDAYALLTGGGGEFRLDLALDELPTLHVMFLKAAVFHPSIQPASRQGILNAAFILFGDQSVATMWHATSALSEAEMAELGFLKIAGEPLVYRHSGYKSPFDEKYPLGHEAKAEGSPEKEAWVSEEWKRLMSVADQDETTPPPNTGGEGDRPG
jgi:hypothetical protein